MFGYSVFLFATIVASIMEKCTTRYFLVKIGDAGERSKLGIYIYIYHIFHHIFSKNGKSKFVGISKTKKLPFDVFLARLAKSNLTVDLLKELNVEKDSRRESIGKTHSILFHY